MATRKRIEITVETDRVLIVHRRKSTRAWCPQCSREVDMNGLADAGVLTGKPEQKLLKSAQSKAWHFSERDDKTPLVCLESVLKSM